MRIVLLGTGYAIPTAERVHTSVLVETSRNLLMFDCGSGVLHRIAESGYDSADVDAVLFTHHHLDHDSDFLSLLKANWLKGRRNMRVYGPYGTADWLSRAMEAYPYLRGKFEVDIKELKDGDTEKIRGDVIGCAQSAHVVTGLIYKLTSKGKSLVYSGDTEPTPRLASLCDGADLLIHECNFLSEDMRGIRGHSNPVSLGKMYRDIRVERLALVHLPPGIGKFEGRVLKAIRRYFKGEIIVGKDLLTLEL